MVFQCRIWSLMIFLSAVIIPYYQVSAAGELLVDTLYKETQDYFQSIKKIVKEKGYIADEVENDKSMTTLKTYIQISSDSIVTILRNLEKDTASYDVRKDVTDMQKDAIELSKLLRNTNIFGSLEKLHDMYLDGLKKLSDKICDFVKINTIRKMVPYPLQSGAEEVYVQVIKITRAIRETATSKKA